MSACESCPFRGCESCEYEGGVDPNQLVPQEERGAVEGSAKRANRTVGGYAWDSKTAPAGNRGLSPSEAAKPHGRTCIT